MRVCVCVSEKHWPERGNSDEREKKKTAEEEEAGCEDVEGLGKGVI